MRICSIPISFLLVVLHLSGCTMASSLAATARSGRTEEARSLLDKGADVNQVSACQTSKFMDYGPHHHSRPIMCAAVEGHLETVKLLLDRGADIAAADPWTYTVLMKAAGAGKTDIVRLLIDRGADVNARTTARVNSGSTALVWAVVSAHSDTASLLIEKGADVDAAMSYLHKHSDPGVTDFSADYAAGLKLLERLTRQAQPATPLAAGGISKEDLTKIVKAAVEGATGVQKSVSPESAARHSDVDTPSYKLVERAEDFALVVGISRYSDIPEAQFAERDAEAVKSHLIAAGFPSRNVIQLFGEKAGRSAMEKFLETWLPRNVNENSRVFFYFSGHGAPDPKTGEAYLIPWDGDPGFLENTGYPIKRLYEKLSMLKAKEVIVALDACFSGAGGRSVLAKGARPLVMKVDTTAVPQNLTVFAAASGDQITSTLEDQGHGTFTYYFLKGLSGGAKNASGRVTTRALYDYLTPKVQDAARRQNRDQKPVLHSQGNWELVRF